MLTKENLPQEWELKALSEVCNINPRKSEVKNYHNSEKVTFLSMESVGENGEIYSQEIKDLGEVFKGYTYFKKNDVLFAKITPCMENGKGTIAKIGTDIGFGSTEFHILRTHKEVIPEWVYRFLALQYTRKYAEQNMTGSAGQKRVPKTFFDKLKIPVPPLETQKKIVEILEKAEKLKELRAEADILADEYLKSVFLEMFGDPAVNPKNFPVKELKNFYSNKKPGTKCGPFGSALKKDEYVDSGIPVWIMDNIVNNHFIEEGCLYITEGKFNQLNSYSVDEGDIIISRAGTVGKMCIVTPSTSKSIISTNLIRLSLDDSKILPIYFTFLMTHFKERIGNLKTGSDGSYTFMNTKVLDALKIPIPPITLQNQFTQIVQQIETLKSYQSQSKQQIDNLFNALMQKAFKGELVC